MANYFASIFGTEKDKVNCSFYFKIGACRHGDRCSRVHNKPSFSQTILIQNLYCNPQNSANKDEFNGDLNEKSSSRDKYMSDEENQKHFDEFFEDIYVELEDKYGPIEEMSVCDNLGDHLIGNVYVKFKKEEDAEKAIEDLNNRWFAGKPVYAELSTVTDFREAACRQYESGGCTRGGFCNFMHIRKPRSSSLRRHLFGSRHKSSRSRRDYSSPQRSRHSSRSRSRSPRDMSRSRSRSSSPLVRHRSLRRKSPTDRSPRDRSPRDRRSSPSSSSHRHRSSNNGRRNRSHRHHHHSKTSSKSRSNPTTTNDNDKNLNNDTNNDDHQNNANNNNNNL